MPPALQAALATALWCVGHSLFITHRWQAFLRRRAPRVRPWERLVYVAWATLSLGVLVLWLRGLPARPLWDWHGPWQVPRWAGLGAAGLLFWLGARGYDGRGFLGLRQIRDHRAGRVPRDPPFRTDGILGRVRHPWYTGTLLVLVCGLPFSDVNLAWRGVFVLYTLVGTELEERKLLAELGATYGDYRRRVPRFLPRPRRRRPPGPPAGRP
jgi:protein-S-isoprenylcysteine O-methyltransferase Ste14